MVCHGNEQRSFCRFWDCVQILHFGLLFTMRATPLLHVVYSGGEMSIPQKWVSISNIHQRENRSHSFSLSNNMTFNVPHAEDLWCKVRILILKADQSGQKSNKKTLIYRKITLMNLWSWAALVVIINIIIIQRMYIKLLLPIGIMLSFFSENLNLILLKLFWSI